MFTKNKPLATPVFLRQCPYCAEMTKLKKEHCVHCGYPLPYLKPTQMRVSYTTSTIRPTQQTSRTLKMKQWLCLSQIIFFGMVAVFFLGVLVFVIFFQNKFSPEPAWFAILGLANIFIGFTMQSMAKYNEGIYWNTKLGPWSAKRNPKEPTNVRFYQIGAIFSFIGITLFALVALPLIIPTQIVIGILMLAILIAGIFLLHLIYKNHVKTN
jgi:hypothetical protein